MFSPANAFFHAATETDTDSTVEERTDVDLDRPWNVIVWDDPINLMSYVVWVFQKLFGFSLEKATAKMMEVHREGRSLVMTCDRERAEVYAGRLHLYGLQATIQRAEG